MENVGSESPLQWVENASRTATFWGRASLIYAAYKVTQLRANLAISLISWSEEEVERRIWEPQHEWAGKQMYLIAVDLRGFYLKVPSAIHPSYLQILPCWLMECNKCQAHLSGSQAHPEQATGKPCINTPLHMSTKKGTAARHSQRKASIPPCLQSRCAERMRVA